MSGIGLDEGKAIVLEVDKHSAGETGEDKEEEGIEREGRGGGG